MKIVHFVEGRCNPDTANGVDKTLYYISREQANLGHEVHMISSTKKDLIAIDGVTMHRVQPFRNPLSCSVDVAALIDEIQPDFGHFHSAYVPGNISVSKALKRRGIPYAVTPNGNCARILLTRRPWMKIPYKVLFERPYLNKAAFVQSVGDQGEIEHYGVKVPIIEALNGIDRKELPNSLDQALLRKIYPEFKDRYICIFVGRLDIEQKGIDLLIPAVARLKKEGLKLGVVMVGPPWKDASGRIESLLDEYEVRDCFALHGASYGDEKYSLIYGADAFIYPSRWEGLPFAVIEAMAMNQLCLVTPASDPAGLLGKHSAGVKFEAEVNAIATGIQRANDLSKEERVEMIQKAAQIVDSQMAWPGIAKRICDAYEKHLFEVGGR